MRQPKDVFVWNILFRHWRTSYLGYPSRLSFGFPPFLMEIKHWFVFGSHPLCPGCSHFSKVQCIHPDLLPSAQTPSLCLRMIPCPLFCVHQGWFMGYVHSYLPALVAAKFSNPLRAPFVSRDPNGFGTALLFLPICLLPSCPFYGIRWKPTRVGFPCPQTIFSC